MVHSPNRRGLGGGRNSQRARRRDYLDKEVATHPNILAWEIPWTGEARPWGHKEWDTTERTHTALYTFLLDFTGSSNSLGPKQNTTLPKFLSCFVSLPAWDFGITLDFFLILGILAVFKICYVS